MEPKRLFFEIYCWICLLPIFPSYYYGGPAAFVVQTVLGGGLACWMDWNIGPSMKNNVKRIVDRGLVPSQFEVLLCIYLTILTSESITLGLGILLCNFSEKYYGGEELLKDIVHWDERLIRNIVLAILFDELVFTTAHRYFLHGTELGAKIHEIHHTCKPSTFSSSFTFHFLDSNTEYTLTVVSMALFSHNCLQDPFALLLSLQIIYMWYSVADHSENVQLGHYFHHQYIDSNYSAYTNICKLKGTDFVRARIKSYHKTTRSSDVAAKVQ